MRFKKLLGLPDYVLTLDVTPPESDYGFAKLLIQREREIKTPLDVVEICTAIQDFVPKDKLPEKLLNNISGDYDFIFGDHCYIDDLLKNETNARIINQNSGWSIITDDHFYTFNKFGILL